MASSHISTQQISDADLDAVSGGLADIITHVVAEGHSGVVVGRAGEHVTGGVVGVPDVSFPGSPVIYG